MRGRLWTHPLLISWNQCFIGLVDFFAIILPGAILVSAWLGLDTLSYLNKIFPPLPIIQSHEVALWVAFIVASYVVGHFVSLLGTRLDFIYDHTYRRYRRLLAEIQYGKGSKASLTEKSESETSLGKIDKWILGFIKMIASFILWLFFLPTKMEGWKAIIKFFTTADEPKDPLLKCAESIKDRSFEELDWETGTNPKNVNTLEWATTMVKLQNSSAGSEIDRLEADSKFFRSLTICLWLILIRFKFIPPKGFNGNLILIVLLILSFLSIARFMVLRWDRTKLTYKNFLSLYILTDSKPI